MASPATNRSQYRSPSTPLDGLRCNCPDLAVRHISRTASNPERPFWCCKRSRSDPDRCRFFKWEDEISATPTPSRGPDSNKRGRSPPSAAKESPRKKAILDALLSEEPETPSKPQTSRPSVTALRGHLGNTHDDDNNGDDEDDDELFQNGQVFKFDPYGGKERSQTSPSSTPRFPILHTTNGLTLSAPLDSTSRKGKAKDKSLFDPPESPLHKARDTSVSNWSPSSLLDHQPSFGKSQETDTDDPAAYIGAVEKLGELPAYLNKVQRRVSEAESAKKTAEIKLREYEERIRALQMENEHLKARHAF